MNFKEEFPLASKVVYFDNAASSLTPRSVLSKVDEYYADYRANIHRGAHRLTLKASEEYERVYSKLAKFFNASQQEFYNVRNATEAINHVALGLDWQVGDEVVTTSIEHHSNLLPWVRLEKKGKIKLKTVAPGRDWIFDIEQFKKQVTKKTKLVAVTACSNVLGNTMPLREIVDVAHDAGSLVLIDAAQYVGHHQIDLKKLDCDFLAFSGHKCFAPTGTGVLFHREGIKLEPAFVGGGTIESADLHDYKLLSHRERYEAGTPDIGGWIGLGAALDFMTSFGLREIEAHDKELIKAMAKGFEGSKAILYGPKAEHKAAAVFAFSLKGVPHHQIAVMLDQLGKICVRSGHHCCLPLTRQLGVDGTVRASLHVYNTLDEVKVFFEAMKKVEALS